MNFRVLGFTPLIYSYCGNDTDLEITLPFYQNDTDFANETSTIPTPIDPTPKNINDIRIIQFAKYNADYYLNPIALIICYYTIALTSSLLLEPKVRNFIYFIFMLNCCINILRALKQSDS